MTRTFQVLAALVAVTICVASAEATPNFKITEVYTGVDGEDGTVDWFELTNLGDMAGNIGGLYYDDNSNDPTNDFQLPNFTVDPGEAVIVLIEADASDIPTFYSFWGIAPADVQVGATGGGSLGQGGDTVNVYAGNFSGAPLVDSLTYPGSLAGMAETIADPTGMGPLMLSQLGVDGAFESAGVSGVGNLIGSPGVPVPEPTTAALAFCGILGLAGLAARRR